MKTPLWSSGRTTAKERLMTLYPTKEDMVEARKKYNSWDHMAKSTGVSKYSLEAHRRAVGVERECSGKRNTRNFMDLSCDEVDANIKELIKGETKNVVTKYKIVDMEAFSRNQREYEGLEFVGLESGSTWREVQHMTPNAIGGYAQ